MNWATVTGVLLMAITTLMSPWHLVFAENLGQKGQVSPLDKDAREQLKDRVRQIPQAQIDRFWSEFRDKNIDAIVNPKSLGIRTDLTVRSLEKVPLFTMPFDALDEKGKVLVKRGTQIRPLEVNPLSWGLVFIDGQDPNQVRFAIEQARKRRLKIVLTAGSAYKLRQQYKDASWIGATKSIPFYFDQKKMVINQLQQLYGISISSVPAQLYMVRDTKNQAALRVVFGLEKS